MSFIFNHALDEFRRDLPITHAPHHVGLPHRFVGAQDDGRLRVGYFPLFQLGGHGRSIFHISRVDLVRAALKFRGYGRSAGSHSQTGIVEDSLAFLDRAAARPEVDPDRLIFHGRSIGGGVACALAAEHPPTALVLQSTFTSLADMAWLAMRVPRLLIRDPFDNAAVVSQLDVPLLVIHGHQDEMIPYAQGQALAQMARKGQMFTHQSGHNDLPMDTEFWKTVLNFLADNRIQEVARE